MGTAFIHSGSKYFFERCRAYFKVYGHTVTDCTAADVAIIDLDYGKPPTILNAKLLVLISARDHPRRELPEKALFRLKPVDVDFLMDFILEEMKRIL